LRIGDLGLSNLEQLESPVWSSLRDRHGKLGQISGKAAVYDWEVSILGGLQEPTADALADLANLVEPGNAVALMGPLTDLPLGHCWEHITRVETHQMICDEPQGFNEQEYVELGSNDVDEMLALAAKTEPGPFSKRTIEMGTYLGIREEGRLVAMAGERLMPEGWSEVSGVCTHESGRGKGYAAALVGQLQQRIHARGELSFLNVVKGSPSEASALGVYERLGFHKVRDMYVTVVINRSSE
jgi:ribosomal protein S18 acetylase RimI-like enzyme